MTYVAHRGYFVALLSLADLLEVYRMREILEAAAVSIAIPLMTAEDIDRFEEAALDVEQASAAEDLTTMAKANRRFHATLIEACALPRMVRIIRQLWDATEVTGRSPTPTNRTGTGCSTSTATWSRLRVPGTRRGCWRFWRPIARTRSLPYDRSLGRVDAAG